MFGNNYLKPESCEGKIPGTWINDKDFNLKESKFYVYSFKCKPDEYVSCKNSIAHTLSSGDVYFDAIFTIARITFYSIVRKIKQIFSKESYGDIKQNKLNEHSIDNKTIRNVCSTYVASVLCENIVSIRKWFVENHKNTKLVSPSDIPNIKGAHFCFSGTFDKYTDCAKKFINKHEEYKPYL